MLLPRRIQARMGAPYQCLPLPETKPKTMWSCMCLPLPNLTRIRARGANTIGAFGSVQEPLPFPTNRPFWLALHSITLLPTLTSRGVKYTHDINCTVLHSNRGPPGLCGISQASDQKKVVVGDGGAKHRSVDPPTEWHNVPTPHAVATIPQGGPAVLTPRPRHPGRTA